MKMAFEARELGGVVGRVLAQRRRHLRHGEVMADGERLVAKTGECSVRQEAVGDHQRAAERDGGCEKWRKARSCGRRAGRRAQRLLLPTSPTAAKFNEAQSALAAVITTPFGAPVVPDV